MAEIPTGKITSSSQAFTCVGFREAIEKATDETMGDVKAAIRSALNKTVKGIKTLVSSEIRNIYNVPRSILDERLTVFSARIQNLESELVIGGKSIPLSYFGMRATTGSQRSTVKVVKTSRGARGKLHTQTMKRSTAQGISIEVEKGHRTTLSKSAFMAVMKSGHIGVMHRGPGEIKSRSMSKGEQHRQAIYENKVISIATMFNKTGVNDAIVAKIDNELEQLFWYELKYFTERSGR